LGANVGVCTAALTGMISPTSTTINKANGDVAVNGRRRRADHDLKGNTGSGEAEGPQTTRDEPVFDDRVSDSRGQLMPPAQERWRRGNRDPGGGDSGSVESWRRWIRT
jgi:hypothetical protein